MPIPKKRKKETTSEWRSRIIKKEIEAGKPQKQAVAISYAITHKGKKRRGK
jgi:hypothetical protein